jgi:hypothetical protein
MTVYIVIAVCANLMGQCAYSPAYPLISREACTQYGRGLQLKRGLKMNSFHCMRGTVK